MADEGVSQGFNEMIGRSLTDDEFRRRLFEDRDKAIIDYQLSPTDLKALERLPRDQLEEQAKRLSGKSECTIKVVISKSF